jgi:uncharacterized protein (UPF0332 family)
MDLKNTKLYLQKSTECITDALALFDASRHTAAVSRSYYAMFHAAQAALLFVGVEAFTHQGVNVQFNKHFIKSGIFEKGVGKMYSRILDKRLKSDYEIGFNATGERSQSYFKRSQRFFRSYYFLH